MEYLTYIIGIHFGVFHFFLFHLQKKKNEAIRLFRLSNA